MNHAGVRGFHGIGSAIAGKPPGHKHGGPGCLPLRMPMYEYEILDRKGEPTGRVLEVFQSMKDAPLVKHPETGEPLRRAVQLPNIAGKWSDMKGKSALSNKNLEQMGFTKYERRGNGYMERVAGKEGPRSISADD